MGMIVNKALHNNCVIAYFEIEMARPQAHVLNLTIQPQRNVTIIYLNSTSCSIIDL